MRVMSQSEQKIFHNRYNDYIEDRTDRYPPHQLALQSEPNYPGPFQPLEVNISKVSAFQNSRFLHFCLKILLFRIYFFLIFP